MQQDYKTLIIYVLTLFVVVLLIVLKKQQDHLSDLENGVLPEEEIEIVLDSLEKEEPIKKDPQDNICLLYTSPSPRDRQKSRMPSSA